MVLKTMYEIVDRLFLSSYKGIEKLKEEYPELITVNCTKEFPMLCPGIRVAVNDDGEEKSVDEMYDAFSQTCEWIQKKLDKGHTVAVHCLAGQQRSPAIIAAYMMWRYNKPLEETKLYIQSIKPDAFYYGANFQGALERWESKKTHSS
jgi:hypothetical protein